MSMIESVNTQRFQNLAAIGLGTAASDTRGASAVEAPQPDLTGPDPVHTASPLETIGALRALENTFADAFASGDPATLMAALAAKMRRATNEGDNAGVSANQAARAVHVERQAAAYKKAQAAQKDAATWGVLAKVGAYVAAAVSVAVGVCGAMYTGGVSLAGGIALAVLCVSAAATTALMMSQDLHAWGSGQPPKWLSIGVAVLAVVAAVCSGGSGAAGALGAFAAVGNGVSLAAQTVNIAMDVAVETRAMREPPRELRMTLGIATAAGGLLNAAGGIGSSSAATGAANAAGSARSAADAAASAGQAVASATEAVGETGSAVTGYQAEMHTADAHRERRTMQQIDERTDDLIEALREAGQSMRRAQQRASETMASESRARSSVTSNLGRA